MPGAERRRRDRSGGCGEGPRTRETIGAKRDPVHLGAGAGCQGALAALGTTRWRRAGRLEASSDPTPPSPGATVGTSLATCAWSYPETVRSAPQGIVIRVPSFHVVVDVSSDDPGALRPVLEELVSGALTELPDGFHIDGVAAGDDVRHANRALQGPTMDCPDSKSKKCNRSAETLKSIR